LFGIEIYSVYAVKCPVVYGTLLVKWSSNVHLYDRVCVMIVVWLLTIVIVLLNGRLFSKDDFYEKPRMSARLKQYVPIVY